MRRRSEETKEVILDAARQQFLNNGYIGTTVDSIAAKAGVTKRTIYGYFPNKRALFKGVTEAAVGEPWDFNMLLSGASTVEGLCNSLFAIAVGVNNVFSDPNYIKLFRVTISEIPSQPDLGVVFERGATRRASRAVAVLLRTANARGVAIFRDPDTAACQFVGGFLTRVVLDGLLQPRSRVRVLTQTELSDYVIDFLGRGLSAKAITVLPLMSAKPLIINVG